MPCSKLVSCLLALLLLASCRKPAETRAPVSAVERGRYLVDHLYGCRDCHTPRGKDGALDMSRYLAGVTCFFDVDPAPGRGCVHSRNLTNHARGLANVTDDGAVQDLFLNGRRPDGKFLHPFMPAYLFHNMPAEDARAIVAFLRTVPGVDHLVPANEPPFDVAPELPTRPLDLKLVPDVPAGAPRRESARRGRLLAAVACAGCHTAPRENPEPGSMPLDAARLFAGVRRFRAARLHLASPPFPELIYSQNLTQHATGLRGWSVEDIVRTLKQGVDREGKGVCPPMPGGPRNAYGNLSDADARDIASYIVTLPGIDNALPNACAVAAP